MEMKDLKVAIIQSKLYWENKEENLKMFSAKISKINESVDLIVLPEMFTTGFTMRPKMFAEGMSGSTMNWMKKTAREKNSSVIGSFICEENKKFYNRLALVFANGTFQIYDKRHLFSMGNEQQHYQAGEERMIAEINGWKICPFICYDLRFPIWSRNTKEKPYDVLIYIANWPEKRKHPWKTLLLARAIENQAYVIGLNRVGEDGNGISHSGDSAIVNSKGEIISTIIANLESTEIISLNYQELHEFRNIFPVLNDAD